MEATHDTQAGDPRSEVELADARRHGWLSIKQAADAARVSAKMIRHYEQVGLLGKARRTAAGYRIYNEADVQTLRFVRQARDQGFSIKDITALLAPWQDRALESAAVADETRQLIAALDRRIGALHSLRGALQRLLSGGQGADRPEYPSIDEPI